MALRNWLLLCKTQITEELVLRNYLGQSTGWLLEVGERDKVLLKSALGMGKPFWDFSSNTLQGLDQDIQREWRGATELLVTDY